MIARVRYQIKRFYADRFMAIQTAVSATLNILVWIYLVLNINLFSESTFLHYSVGVGVDYVGKRSDVFSMPIIGLLILAINSAYAFIMFTNSKYTAYVFMGLATLWHICIAIAAVLMVSLNA